MRLVRGMLLVVVWVSAAAALRGFVLPWARLDVKYRQVTGALNEAAQSVPLGDLMGKLAKKVGRVAVTVKRGAETVTGELPDLSKIPTQVSGADIPRLANQQDAQVALALAEMFTGQRELSTKAWLVYLVPGLALAAGVLLTLGRRLRWICASVGALCLGIAGFAAWKLSTTPTDTLLVAITIGPGLWLSCWAYAALGVSSLVLAAVDARSSARL